MLIRPMVASDVAAVANVEEQFVSAWTKAQIHVEFNRKSGITLVAENAQGIVGWCCGILLAPEAELFKIAVTVNNQQQGIANLLLQEFTTLLAKNGVEQIFLEVRSANISALALYDGAGWEKQGKRKKYYTNPVDDAILLVRSLTPVVNGWPV